MQFLKENSSIIGKLYINQIGIAIFSMFLYTGVAAIQGDAEGGYSTILKVVVSILALSFYCFLIYLAIWELGAKDKIRIDAGRAEKTPLKGFILGIVANAVNFIVWIISTLLIGIHILNQSEAVKSVFAVINGIFRIFSSMYLGVVQGIASLFIGVSDNHYYLIESLGFTLLPILSVAVISFAYFMGSNNLRIIPQKNK